MDEVCIYALVDPRNDDIRYVGKSVKPYRRCGEHISEARNGSRLHVSNWIKGLLSEGMKPKVFVLEHCWGDDAEREREWIATMRDLGEPLTNLTEGGEGLTGHEFSEEHCQRISTSLRGRRAWNKGIPRSEETKRKLRVANLGKKHSKESRQKMSASRKGARLAPEHRQKISEAARRNWAAGLYESIDWSQREVSEEARRKISEARKRQWSEGVYDHLRGKQSVQNPNES